MCWKFLEVTAPKSNIDTKNDTIFEAGKITISKATIIFSIQGGPQPVINGDISPSKYGYNPSYPFIRSFIEAP